MENFIVVLIVLIAGAATVRSVCQSVAKGGCGCSCGQGKCGAAKTCGAKDEKDEI